MTPKGECVPLVDMCTTRLCQRDEEWLPSLSTLKTDNVYLVNPPCVEICPPHFSYLLYVGAVGTEQWPLEAYGGDSLRGQWPDEWVRSLFNVNPSIWCLLPLFHHCITMFLTTG